MLSTHQSDLFAQLLVRASVDLFLSPLNSKEFSESLVLCLLSLYTWLLFNFQWALWFACCLSAAYLLYHIRLPLSRGFSNFFQVFLQFLSDLLSRLSAACILYHSRFRLSRGFSNFFSSFLRFFFGSARSLVDSLYSISHQVYFVKSFLKLFWVFLTCCLLCLCLSDSPIIISHHPSLVNTFLQSFSTFFAKSLIHSLAVIPQQSRTPNPTSGRLMSRPYRIPFIPL